MRNNVDYKRFKKIGWTDKEIINQIKNANNLSICLWVKKELVGFIIGNLITLENLSEYEIFIVYIDKKYRKLGYASCLINYIKDYPIKYMLKKITLEVSRNNNEAINLYKKNNFHQIGIRKNYYKFNDSSKDDALIFERILNEK